MSDSISLPQESETRNIEYSPSKSENHSEQDIKVIGS